MTVNVTEYIDRLRSRGIHLEADGDRLRVRAPKGALTPELQSELKERKGELLEYVRHEGAASDSAPALRRRRAEEGVHPASFTQEQFWYLQGLDPGSTAYHVPTAYRIRGPLDADILEQSLNHLRRHHEALRSILQMEDGKLLQFVRPFTPMKLVCRALPSGLDEERRLAALLREEIQAPFEPSDEPPFRAVLVRIAEDDHAFLHVAHHAFFDGVSETIFFKELFSTYAALVQGENLPVPKPVVQYGDAARWQRKRLEGPRLDGLIDHWRHRLDGLPGPIDLPRIGGGRSIRSSRGMVERSHLPTVILDQLRDVGREARATSFMIFLSVLHLLLHRYSRQEDIVVGVPVAGRQRKELHEAIGAFINTVLIRVDLSDNPSFMELLARVRSRTLEALEHQELPLGALAEALAPERAASRDPLVQVLFRHWTIDGGAAHVPGLETERIRVDTGATLADLDISISEGTDTLEATIAYSTDLFHRDTVSRLLGHYEILLQGALADPERPVSELPLLTREEERKILVEWAGTSVDMGEPATLDGLLEDAAERWPDGPAVQAGSDTLTRRELESLANRLAHRLREEGVGPGVRVGILLPRNAEMVVALLAVLKAGGAYLPLDPDFPEARLAFMLEDARAPLVLTTRGLSPVLAEASSARALLLDEEREEIAQRPATPPPSSEPSPDLRAGPDDPAYTIYTSGSTGRPKGVEVPHRAAVNFLRSMAREPGIAPGERLLAITTLSFDISVLELLLPLLTGATVVIADSETAADGRRLRSVLEEEGITAMQATPATWRLLIDAGWTGEMPLRVLSGGEALPSDLAHELLERSPEVWNLYGPTEATVWCTRHRLTTAEEPIPIGRPIENTRAYILDPSGNPVPMGVTGDLWIAGEQLALGYIDRPELEEERFRPDPFTQDPDARMYRTGDLARWMSDGSIQCLGRTDHQVKVRGFRIELGEVEAALARLDEVRQAVVDVHDDGKGDSRLVAWVLYERSRELLGSELRMALREHLPGYMVPSLVVEVPEIPLTASGKVNRKALPDPLGESRSPEEDFVEPSSPTERAIAKIWKETLGLPRVGSRDNFFDLGGHSLLAMRTLFRMEEETGCRLEPRDMILGTLGQIAAVAEERANESDLQAVQ